MTYRPSITFRTTTGTYNYDVPSDCTWMKVMAVGAGASGRLRSVADAWNERGGSPGGVALKNFNVTPDSPSTAWMNVGAAVYDTTGASTSFAYDGITITGGGGWLAGYTGSGVGSGGDYNLAGNWAMGYNATLVATDYRARGQIGAPIINARYRGHGGSAICNTHTNYGSVRAGGNGVVWIEAHRRGTQKLVSVSTYTDNGAFTHVFSKETKWSKVIVTGAGAGAQNYALPWTGRGGGAGSTSIRYFEVFGAASRTATGVVGLGSSSPNVNTVGGTSTFSYDGYILSATGGINYAQKDGTNNTGPSGGHINLYPVTRSSHKWVSDNDRNRHTHIATAPMWNSENYGSGAPGSTTHASSVNFPGGNGIVYIEEYG